MNESIRLTNGRIIDKRWKVEKFLGEGHFHQAYYEVTDIQRPICSYCLKVSNKLTKKYIFIRFSLFQGRIKHDQTRRSAEIFSIGKEINESK